MSSARDLYVATPNGLYKRSANGEQTLIIEEAVYALHSGNGLLWVSTDRAVRKVNLVGDEPPVEYVLTTITAPYTAVYSTSSDLWVGGSNGVARAEIDLTTGSLGPWSECRCR